MDSKSILKWGVVVIALLVAWRLLGSVVGALASSLNSSQSSAQSQPIGELGPTVWQPNYYYPGVYGPWNPNGPWPVVIPPNSPGWPFYDSPQGPGRLPDRPIPY